MKTWRLGVSVAALVAVSLCGSLAHAGDLAFEQRVAAQAAIERVYYSHQIGTTAPFEEVVPREVIERKVRTYLEQSAALERFWHAPVTAELLRREMERQARESRMPGRLAELWAALGNDPFLVQECLARPALVDRLVRSFHAGSAEAAESPRPYDDWWNEVRGMLAAERVEAVADPLASLPPLAGVAASGSPDGPPCLPDDTWHNGSLDDIPDARLAPRAVWTGSLMILWGGRTTRDNTGDRYDPATSTWTPVTTVDAPSPRSGHTAVWTGSVMIVWGGSPNLNTGGRYNPSTDSWTPTSTIGAPAARARHTAVWAGNQMIVWGGEDYATSIRMNTGGRYDPAGDTWSPTSTTGAPTARYDNGAVWTGSRMVIWGGHDGNYVNTGGRYDPVGDTWLPTSTTGAPAARSRVAAVWTGSRMVVWGGFAGGGVALNDGSRYDPSLDHWAATSTTGAPAARWMHAVVWSGSRMIVWGGYDGDYVRFDDGSRYDPVGDSWSPTSMNGAPAPRAEFAAVWADTQMIVWGGSGSVGTTNTGGRYDPSTDSWTPTNESTAPIPRSRHAAVWTGTLMVVWGGEGAGARQDGGRYDPALDTWIPTTLSGAPEARRGPTAVWTGRELVVWGGTTVLNSDWVPINSGGRYDPIADRWTPTAQTGAPSARDLHGAVWTGSRMIVWGGTDGINDLNTGGRYDPTGDSWTATSLVGAAPARQRHSTVWTGSRMIVWGGLRGATFLRSGARYDPVSDSWALTSTDGAPSARNAHTAVWTGSRMVVWGGDNGSTVLNTGGRYDPAGNAWVATSTVGAPEIRTGHTAVWGAGRMIVWGGENSPGSLQCLNTGGRYDPVSDAWLQTSLAGVPTPRYEHTSVWTGSDAMIWGGRHDRTLNSGGLYALGHASDDDSDGVSECGGDCNDASAAIYPGASELCDGLDNDCDTLVDDGFVVPGGVAGLAVEPVGGTAHLSWPGLVSASAYDVVSGTLSVLGGTAGNFTPATDRCLANDLAVTTLDDGATPSLADGFWYLVRAVSCVGAGTYDDGGAGQQGVRDAEIGAAPGACP